MSRYELLPQEIHLIVEKKIYYLCYSRESKYKIPGYDQDDLAQELRAHIYRKLEKYDLDESKNPAGWIVTCMKRQLIDLWRKSQRSKDVYNHCEICSLFDDE